MEWIDTFMRALVGQTPEQRQAPHTYTDSHSSGGDDDSRSDASESYSAEEEPGAALLQDLHENAYFDVLGARQLAECETAVYYFEAFRREREMQKHYQFAGQGLEYLMDAPMRARLPIEASFWGIHIEPARRGQPVPGMANVFLVSRALDFMYSYVVERALWPAQPAPEMVRACDDYRRQKLVRAQRIHCRQRHRGQQDQRRCPGEWVLYARRDTALYQYGQRLMDNDALCNYELDAGFSAEPLSYSLVNFLCALTAEQALTAVEQYAEWVALPPLYLTLWNAGGMAK